MERRLEIPFGESTEAKPIETDADCCVALREVETLKIAEAGTREDRRVDAAQ